MDSVESVHIVSYVPAAQNALQYALPGDEVFPFSHSVHVVTEVAADTVEYLPLSQRVHAASAVTADAAEYLPAAQLLHAAGPFTGLYFPGEHCVHGMPSSRKPVYPGLH